MKLLGALLALVLLVGLRRLDRVADGAPLAARAAAFGELALVVGLVAGVVGALAGPAGWTGEGLLVALGLVVLAGARQGADYVAGITLRASGSIAVGDRVQADGQAGRVVGLGAFRAVLRSEAGEVSVPWSRLARASIERPALEASRQKHSFELSWTDGRPLTEVCELVRRTVLLDARTPAGEPPQLEPLAPASLLVHVTTLDARTAFELEELLRRVVAQE